MDKVFVDTNIVLDLLGAREQFLAEAQQLFALAEHKKINLYVSGLTIANVHYVLSKQLPAKKVKEVLRKFMLLVKILELNAKIIELSVESDFKDFEDAIQYYTAIENNIPVIVTRNLKDFRIARIPVMTAGEYLKLRISNKED